MAQRHVVILLSDKRSGSTAFQAEICKHSMVNHVDYSPHTYFETQHWLKSAVLLDYPPSLFLGGRAFPNYGSKRNARTYLIDLIKGNVPDYQVPSDDKQLVFQGWGALCERFAHPVFFEKSPQVLGHWAAISLILEWAEQSPFSVKFIGLVRNPLAVQHSALKLFGTSPESRQFDWINAQINLLALQSYLPKSAFKLIKYEDFIQAPKNTLDEVCHFIGIPFEENLGASIHSDSVLKWRNNDFQMPVHSALEMISKTFGYELDRQIDPNNSNRSGRVGDQRISRSYQKLKNRLINAHLKPIMLRRKGK